MKTINTIILISIFISLIANAQVDIDTLDLCKKIKKETLTCYKAKKSNYGKVKTFEIQDPSKLTKFTYDATKEIAYYNKNGDLIESKKYDIENNLISIIHYFQKNFSWFNYGQIYKYFNNEFDYQTYRFSKTTKVNDSISMTVDSIFNFYGEYERSSKTFLTKNVNNKYTITTYYYDQNGELENFNIDSINDKFKEQFYYYFNKDSLLTRFSKNITTYDSLNNKESYLRLTFSSSLDTLSKYFIQYNSSKEKIYEAHYDFEENTQRVLFYSYDYDDCNNWITKYVYDDKKKLIYLIKRELVYWELYELGIKKP